jgi:hypothetical protein
MKRLKSVVARVARPQHGLSSYQRSLPMRFDAVKVFETLLRFGVGNGRAIFGTRWLLNAS